MIDDLLILSILQNFLAFALMLMVIYLNRDMHQDYENQIDTVQTIIRDLEHIARNLRQDLSKLPLRKQPKPTRLFRTK